MNKIIIAAAGAGKTQHIVEKAYELHEPVLITTYTEDNTLEIGSRFYKLFGAIPKHVTILPWFTFLMRYLIKPFQNDFCPSIIIGTAQANGVSAKFTTRDQLRHYLTPDSRIYTDKIGELAHKLNADFDGFPLKNLSRIFAHIFVDEMQDMGGYDIEVLKAFIESPVNLTAVGDPRQSTFLTSYCAKNKGKNRINVLDSFRKNQNLIIDEHSLNTNHRCCESICTYSNSLFPDFPPAECDTNYEDVHQGLYVVRQEDIIEYIEKYHPQQLIYNKNSPFCAHFNHITIGKSKGKTYQRTLIFAPETFHNFMFKGKQMKPKSQSDFYIALTRAQLSAAIVYNYADDFESQYFTRYK